MSVFIVFAITVGPPRIGVTATVAVVIAGNLVSQGDDETARQSFEESAELARSSGDDAALALALGGLSRVALRAEDPALTRELALQVLGLVTGEAAEYSPRHMLAAAARGEGDHARAEELYGETLVPGYSPRQRPRSTGWAPRSTQARRRSTRPRSRSLGTGLRQPGRRAAG